MNPAWWVLIAAVVLMTIAGVFALYRMGDALKRVEDEGRDREDWR